MTVFLIILLVIVLIMFMAGIFSLIKDDSFLSGFFCYYFIEAIGQLIIIIIQAIADSVGNND